ncbi:MAG: serine dehydratase subunit alpha family protein [Bacteroidales bacterium]|nr:serine dehydratase subunit alpha family protein [Bacteroidales bacterium]
MELEERACIIELIKREVVPAIGCTEPVAVALAVAKCTEVLGCRPEKVELFLSANILKNAMGVGIPGTGMIGLPIAVALGSICGKSEYQLEVLRDVDDNAISLAKQFIDEKRIHISQKKDITEKLYIEVLCSCGSDTAKVVISGGHTNFVHISRNADVMLSKSASACADTEEKKVSLSMRKVFDFATTAPIEEISFILDAGDMNLDIANKSFDNNYGHTLGKILHNSTHNDLFGDGILKDIMSYTSAACDARMAGCPSPVMSNSGSGNQGIATTVPVCIYARDTKQPKEKLIRALILSNLTSIYIKQSLGRLSALCGCVVASTGSSCGITYLMGGGYEQVCYSVKNMIANITGMICDGAKPSCSLKLATGISSAVLSSTLAMENHCVSSVEGIIDDDVDNTIKNLTLIGTSGMNETDKYVLNIMTSKK